MIADRHEVLSTPGRGAFGHTRPGPRGRVLSFALATFTPSLSAQGVKRALGDFGIGIGDVPRLDGLRLNFRDDGLRLVRGINASGVTGVESEP